MCVVLEASKYRKPILCSALPIFEEILLPEGVFYFDNSVESIQKVICKFVKLSSEEKRIMGEINYGNLRRFTFDRVKQKYYELFQSQFF